MSLLDTQLPQFVVLDLPALLTALFSCLTCALLGNFLVLRRMSLMGDSIAHAVLPGIVLAFLLSGSRANLPVFLGAALAGVCAAVLIELVRKLGRVEVGAAMGVVFSIFFAVGVLLMEQAAARSVDLDADCLLHGQLESVFWPVRGTIREIYSKQMLSNIPAELVLSLIVLTLVAILTRMFFKELVLTSFDSALATALGIRASLVHYGLMVAVAFAVVASFKVVGSILVISMLICPAAAARLLTDRIRIQIAWSLVFAVITAVGGYFCGAFLPTILGWKNSVNIAGSMSVVAGLLLAFSVCFAPRYGMLSRLVRRSLVGIRVTSEDILGLLYRLEEMKSQGATRHFTARDVRRIVGGGVRPFVSFWLLRRSGEIYWNEQSPGLTDSGRKRALKVIRTHRLWEVFLVSELGLRPDHVHESARDLEHFGQAAALESHLESSAISTKADPHGKPIPQDIEKLP